jgi:hypothetical protein
MQGLRVDTSPQASNSHANSPSLSRSSSPTRPPYSPITPTLCPTFLTTSSSRPQDDSHGSSRKIYTHTQPSQTAIPQPSPEPIYLDSNPDALALKSAISILQIQARNATVDIQSLQTIKDRALEDPVGFTAALTKGDVRGKSDILSRIPTQDEDTEEDDEEAQTTNESKAWPKLPAPQHVVRCPPINWNQYALVGDSLNKLHADQQSRPTEGTPQRLGPNGQLVFGGDGQRKQANIGIAAPYAPSRDKIDKNGPKKGARK